MSTKRTVIVGTGPAGTSVATALAAAGVSSLLIGRTPPAAGIAAPCRIRTATVFHAEPGRLLVLDKDGVRTEPFDTLVLATGTYTAELPDGDGRWRAVALHPEAHLAAALDCAFALDESTACLVPTRFADGRSSVPWIFVAGGVAGAPDAASADADGRLVAETILRDRDASGSEPATEPVTRLLAPLAVPLALPDLAEDFVICRSTGVSLDTAKAAIDAGAADLFRLGQHTTAGAGFCRGRRSWLALTALLRERTGAPLSDLLHPAFEFPAVSVPLPALAAWHQPESSL
ncbi:hypothetical protein [Marinivivus vitaminiproducens]|uniref:hypothetical protein n=1 Tax=Marinivivus vitaminiproducens TaxID=3035935 RepID=UPI00279AFEB2|nr:hypothetical protein P4R82_10560 [Geminicoccaceae bacterium SCSIO 64248]